VNGNMRHNQSLVTVREGGGNTRKEKDRSLLVSS
jgi:hypothetical protein